MKSTVCILAVAFAASVGARVLPETLLLPQCEFYPIREQDRGFLYRYTDLPLFVEPDLPEDAPDPKFETRRHRYWGEWFSQADWNRAEELGKDFGFDGHAFFPRPHRVRYWDAMEKSPVRGFFEVPIAHNYSEDGSDLSKWFGFAAKSTRGYRVNGKALILSYRFGAANPPERLKMKLDRMRREVGDSFLFVCDLSELYRPDEAIDHGRLSDKTVAAYKEKVRAYLRVCDGVIVGDAFSCMTFEGKTRVFFSSHYEQLVALLKETVEEPEFAGRKLLGLAAVLQHENPSVQFWTANEDGLRTLTESLRIACAAQPDIILLPEWDEFNENTCVGPTLANGLTVKRIVNYYRSVLGKASLAPLPGDDVSKPNLIVSYRRLVSPGDRFLVDVLNVPDGARQGKLAVSAEIVDPQGKILVSAPVQNLREEEVGHARFPVPSAFLAERARAVRVRVRYAAADGVSQVVEEGLSPVGLLSGSSFCLKETHQPIRDLAAMRPTASVVWENGRVTARLAADEPIRHAYLCGNGQVQRVFGDWADPVAHFVEDASNLVFAVSGVRPEMLDRQKFAYDVEGVSVAQWLDFRGIHDGARFSTDWISTIGDPYYLRIPLAEARGAVLNIDFGEQFRGTVPFDAVLANGFYALCGTNGIQFTVTRFRRQPRYPRARRSKELAFSVLPDPDRASMAYHVALVTASGRTWRSRPIVVESPSAAVPVRVWDDVTSRFCSLSVPQSRVPRIRYDLQADAGDGVPTADGFRRFATVAGGQYSCVTLWNRSSAGSLDYPLGFKRTDLASGSAAPAHVRRSGQPAELVFDGVNDSIAFPWETVPQNAAYRVRVDLCPSSTAGSVALFGSKSLFNATLEEGELVVSAAGVSRVRTGLRLTADRWQAVEFRHRGETFVVSVDAKTFETSAKLPATFMSSLVFGQPPNGTKTVFYRGRLRNLSFDSICE